MGKERWSHRPAGEQKRKTHPARNRTEPCPSHAAVARCLESQSCLCAYGFIIHSPRLSPLGFRGYDACIAAVAVLSSPGIGHGREMPDGDCRARGWCDDIRDGGDWAVGRLAERMRGGSKQRRARKPLQSAGTLYVDSRDALLHEPSTLATQGQESRPPAGALRCFRLVGQGHKARASLYTPYLAVGGTMRP